MATLPKLDELTTDQIKYIIEEYNHQLTHLERSQTELQNALAESPDDSDFKQAFDENVIVIERRKDLIAVMLQYLEENDPFFDKSYVGKRLSHEQSSERITASSTSNGPILLESEAEEVPNSEGVYL